MRVGGAVSASGGWPAAQRGSRHRRAAPFPKTTNPSVAVDSARTHVPARGRPAGSGRSVGGGDSGAHRTVRAGIRGGPEAAPTTAGSGPSPSARQSPPTTGPSQRPPPDKARRSAGRRESGLAENSDSGPRAGGAKAAAQEGPTRARTIVAGGAAPPPPIPRHTGASDLGRPFALDHGDPVCPDFFRWDPKASNGLSRINFVRANAKTGD